MKLQIKITLRSDATFGRGEGVAGSIDTEIEYDTRTGLPYLRGRTLRGLIVEECANILFALSLQMDTGNEAKTEVLNQAAEKLFGKPGSRETDSGILQVGAATFPEDLQAVIRKEINDKNLTVSEVLDLLTTVRRQTAMDEKTDAPRQNSLRTQRVLLRGSALVALLEISRDLNALQIALLSASVSSLQRGGSGRNRGRGRLQAVLQTVEGKVLTDIDSLFASVEPQGVTTQ